MTGASAGVGREVARLYGERGAAVALLARGTTGLAGAAADVRAAGGARWSCPATSRTTSRSTPRPSGRRPSSARSTSGSTWRSARCSRPSKEITAEEFRRATEVSYLGFVYGTKAALDRMCPRDRGAIVQVGSALAYRGIPLQSAYCGAKHAIQGFTESVRCRAAARQEQRARHDGAAAGGEHAAVRLGALPAAAPRAARGADLPAGGRGRAIVYAGDHPQRREYWVGAPTVGTLIGDKFAGGLLDRYLGRTGYDSQQTPRAAAPGRPGEPLGAGGRPGRPRPRRPRPVRRPGEVPQPPALGLPPPRPAERVGGPGGGGGRRRGPPAPALTRESLRSPPESLRSPARVATFAAASRYVRPRESRGRGVRTAELVRATRQVSAHEFGVSYTGA